MASNCDIKFPNHRFKSFLFCVIILTGSGFVCELMRFRQKCSNKLNSVNVILALFRGVATDCVLARIPGKSTD